MDDCYTVISYTDYSLLFFGLKYTFLHKVLYISGMEEKWKLMEKGYAVSNLGNVKNLKTQRILKGFVMNDTKYVRVLIDGKQANRSVNKAVRENFYPEDIKRPAKRLSL
jgi:hypothetical protein